MPAEVEFTEVAAEPKVESVAYAHRSVELGHLYMEDLQRGPDFLRAHFRDIAPWYHAARQSCVDSLGGPTPADRGEPALDLCRYRTVGRRRGYPHLVLPVPGRGLAAAAVGPAAP